MKLKSTLLATLSLVLLGPVATMSGVSRPILSGSEQGTSVLLAAAPFQPDEREESEDPAGVAVPADSASGELETQPSESGTGQVQDAVEQPGSAVAQRNRPAAQRSPRTGLRGSGPAPSERRAGATQENLRAGGSGSPSRRSSTRSRSVGRSRDRGALNREDRTSQSPTPIDSATVQFIAGRNIFNTTRSPRSNRTEEGRGTAPAETMTLVGILSYEKGSYAFFDGSASQNRKVVQAGGSVAGYQVIGMTPDAVTLQASTNTLELRVGMKLRKGEQGWDLAGGGVPATLAPAGAVGSGPAALSADGDEAVKRLMAQRDQELK